MDSCNAQWQPIETAPRDGTYVLLFMGEEYPPDSLSLYDARYVLACWNKKKGRWLETRDMGRGNWRVFPTHWIPLPPPPNEGEKSNLDEPKEQR